MEGWSWALSILVSAWSGVADVDFGATSLLRYKWPRWRSFHVGYCPRRWLDSGPTRQEAGPQLSRRLRDGIAVQCSTGKCCPLHRGFDAAVHCTCEIPTNTARRTDVGVMLGQRRRRWPNITRTLVQLPVLAGRDAHWHVWDAVPFNGIDAIIKAESGGWGPSSERARLSGPSHKRHRRAPSPASTRHARPPVLPR